MNGLFRTSSIGTASNKCKTSEHPLIIPTSKTFTKIEIIRQGYKENNKILISTDSEIFMVNLCNGTAEKVVQNQSS